jgi:hypothetical protein
VAIGELGAPELKRRIEAARLLRAISQETLDERFGEDGLGKKAAGRLERGDLELTRALLDGLVRHLRMPEAWFTAKNFDEVLYSGGDGQLAVEMVAIRSGLDRLLAARDQAMRELGPLATDPEAARDVLDWLSRLTAQQDRDLGRDELRSRGARDRLAGGGANGG